MPATPTVKAFDRLHKSVHERLYAMNWTELRPIQVEAIRGILDGRKRIIISGATASGKTEAAFLPIISRIADDYVGSVHALYVGPLRALINDQFRRLEDLCERAEIPVHRWHGDIGQAARKRLLNQPSGILLITPESIESLFINQSVHLPVLFRQLQYIVIDELHSFFGTERGAHLKSLLSRLTRFCSSEPAVVGLSATLGDVHLASQWIFGDAQDVLPICEATGEKEIRFSLHEYVIPPTPSVEDVGDETKYAPEMPKDLVRWFGGKTALIFGNSKAHIEEVADGTISLAESLGMRDAFRVHHGSLSRAEREESESALRSDRPTSVFCSSTLEMGIDVGNVAIIGQIGAPFSVNSLIQRLGRSGRKPGQSSQMRLIVEEYDKAQGENPVDGLYPSLLQAIAMSELAFEHWCEPPDTNRAHLSTLVQQVLSVITQKGSADRETLFASLVRHGAFKRVTGDAFDHVLASMRSEEHDLVELTAEGDYILGIKGEGIVRSLDFYAAFPSRVDWTVRHKERKIGSVTIPPPVGECLILAGKRWEVVDLDPQRLEAVVERAHGRKKPMFLGDADTDIHPVVRRRMFEIVTGAPVGKYLDSTAEELLVAAQEAARRLGLKSKCALQHGKDVYWFTWTGDRTQRTLELLCEEAGYKEDKVTSEQRIALRFEGTTIANVSAAVNEVLDRPPSASRLAARFPRKHIEKYDDFIPEDLLNERVGIERLDLEGALRLASSLVTPVHSS